MDRYCLRRLKQKAITTVLTVSLLFISGCWQWGGFGQYGTQSLQGLVFTKITVPFTTDLNHTPFHEIRSRADGKVVQIKEPISGQGIYVQFDSNAIGDIAKEHGLKTVWFADMEIFNVLGIWSYKKIYIYGE